MIKRKLLARYEGGGERFVSAGEQRSARLLDRTVHFSLGAGVQHQVGCQRCGAEDRTRICSIPNGKAASPWITSRTIGTSFRCAIWKSVTAKKRRPDYMKKLAAQQMQWRKGHSLIGQLMSAGEFPLAAELQVHTVERAKAQGAPVDWSVLDGVIPISKVAAAITSNRREQYIPPRCSTIFCCRGRAWKPFARAGGFRLGPT